MLNTDLKQPLDTSTEHFDVLLYSCGFDDLDLKMSLTSQLVHLVSNSNLVDKGGHFKSLERPVRKFVKKSLDLLETGVQEAKLRVLLQLVADIQVEARSISINTYVNNIEDVMSHCRSLLAPTLSFSTT